MAQCFRMRRATFNASTRQLTKSTGRGRPKPRTTSIVNDIIIQARCAPILTHLPATGRAAYLAVMENSVHSLDDQSRVIAGHMPRMGQNEVTRRRFSNFSYSLYVHIPSHSGSFSHELMQAVKTERSGETYVHGSKIMRIVSNSMLAPEVWTGTLRWLKAVTTGTSSSAGLCMSFWNGMARSQKQRSSVLATKSIAKDMSFLMTRATTTNGWCQRSPGQRITLR
jgi:hypothetical protein